MLQPRTGTVIPVIGVVLPGPNAPSTEVRAAVATASAFSRPRRQAARSAAAIAVASAAARNRSPARTMASASVALAKAGAVAHGRVTSVPGSRVLWLSLTFVSLLRASL